MSECKKPWVVRKTGAGHRYGFIFGAAVGIDDQSPAGREILRQSFVDGANDLPNRPGVVIAGNPDDDVSFFDLLELLQNFRAEDDLFGHRGGIC